MRRVGADGHDDWAVHDQHSWSWPEADARTKRLVLDSLPLLHAARMQLGIDLPPRKPASKR